VSAAQGQSGEVAVIANENIEDEVVNTGCLVAKALEEIEVRSASVIQRNDLSIDNCAFWKFTERFNKIGVLRVERLPATGVQVDCGTRFDGNSAVAV